ncbi:MAG: ChbG/HpnK family deacetylase, partial [Phycisphaerae bacterium]|nr:ChbG/HpnK family deacetylase [Phycisphaerae bacterium]
LGEFEAQIQRALDLGVRPTHLDSHRHMHAFPPLFAGVVRLARKYAIPWVRWPCETLRGRGWPRPPRGQAGVAEILRALCRMSTAAGSQVRATRGTWGIAHTGRIDAAWLIHAARLLPEGATEIMVHPGLADGLDARDSRLADSRPRELQSLCDPTVREAFVRNHRQMIHYGQLGARQV